MSRLASRAFWRPTGPSILSLPPSLRAAFYQNATTRHFSASTPRNTDLIDVVLVPPLALLNTIHSAGVPWYAAIPTAAVLARGVLAYFLCAKPMHLRTQTTALLGPVITATSNANLRKQTIQTGFEPLQDPRAPYWVKVAKLALQRYGWAKPIVNQFYKPKVQYPQWWNFAILLAMAEAVRMKCGAQGGLLPSLLSPIQWVARQIAPASLSDPQQRIVNELAEKTAAIRSARISKALAQGQDPSLMTQNPMQDFIVAKTQLANAPHIKEINPYFDPSLIDGGLPWCSDLTIPDPTILLPIAFFAVLAGRVLLNPRRPATSWLQPLKRYDILQQLSLALYVFIAYVSHAWPAGILLYITSSFAVGAAQARWLKITMPVSKAIVPCARPTRVKAKKGWRDLQ